MINLHLFFLQLILGETKEKKNFGLWLIGEKEDFDFSKLVKKKDFGFW